MDTRVPCNAKATRAAALAAEENIKITVCWEQSGVYDEAVYETMSVRTKRNWRSSVTKKRNIASSVRTNKKTVNPKLQRLRQTTSTLLLRRRQCLD